MKSILLGVVKIADATHNMYNVTFHLREQQVLICCQIMHHA